MSKKKRPGRSPLSGPADRAAVRRYFNGTTAARPSFPLTKETRYVRGKRPGAATDVKVGERAVVSVIEKDGKKVVREMRLGDAKASQAISDKH